MGRNAWILRGGGSRRVAASTSISAAGPSGADIHTANGQGWVRWVNGHVVLST